MTHLSSRTIIWGIVALVVLVLVIYSLFNLGGTTNGTGL
jgi:hypothetical protein